MTGQVWKYTLAPVDAVEMPAGARLLHVAEQRGEVCLWALVDPTAGMERRIFRVVGTGHDFEADGHDYVGTAHLLDGQLVFHVFEERAS